MSFEKLEYASVVPRPPICGPGHGPPVGGRPEAFAVVRVGVNHAAASTTAKPTPMADKPPITDANHTISRSSSHKVFHMCALPHSIRQLKINGTSIT
jgi:hypothetical protein